MADAPFSEASKTIMAEFSTAQRTIQDRVVDIAQAEPVADTAQWGGEEIDG
ncbi:hypothetical protein [Streptomyces sp. AM8-1-1]|uniref:hypothetical protein n=1 Tax=Streptomyces sp. AM8-1-1 TaxID=3075825 RepID=UPI0028C45ADB|nr:hypothetical protein [Streptomyces sp. AM8-1-1]WNO76849.1 hypothetical protein RPQ07_36835 [Streptomyces sp. AM8-1-1]